MNILLPIIGFLAGVGFVSMFGWVFGPRGQILAVLILCALWAITKLTVTSEVIEK